MRRVAGVLLFAIAVAGCGKETTRIDYENHPVVIRQSQVERYGAGTPERAAIEWGRAVIYADAVTAARLYDPALGVAPRDLPARLEPVQTAVSAFRGVRVVKVMRRGKSRATVVADVTGSAGNSSKVSHLLISFDMKRVKGHWKLATLLPKIGGGAG